jgi:phosphohistidine swiveling domain-containing protein
MNRKFPKTLADLQCELLEHSKDGDSTVPMRVTIVNDNYGAFCRHISHDRVLNPVSRPHGTPQSKINDAGHFLVQSMTLVALSGVDLQEAIEMALVSLRGKDFMARPASNTQGNTLCGTVACTAKGQVEARAWVCKDDTDPWPVVWDEPLILVIPHAEADARLKHFSGIITDHGGMFCHAGIIARECGIPCIASTGDASKRIQTGDLVRMNTIDGIITLVEY